VHAMLVRSFDALRKQKRRLTDAAQNTAKTLMARENEIDVRLLSIVSRKLDVVRIRCHGDLHLGQVLFTGDDFVFIHFEGEPARPLFERRYRRSSLRDVAGMLRSFDYAISMALASSPVRPEDMPVLQPWGRAWVAWSEAIYLRSYLATANGSNFLPSSDADIDLLLEFYSLEKCIYEIGHELRNRPDWVDIPLRGLERLATGRQ
jgi:maltose alpha-D-glucosyltransferase/alpha-amylase